MRRSLAAALAALCAAGVAAAPAAAHGDPASEYLVSHEVFFPLRSPPPPADRARLSAVVEQARRRGYAIRIALIGSRFDLGTEGDAWGRPGAYAASLDADLAYYYRGPLLVVMPAGLALQQPGRRLAADRAVVAAIRIRPSVAGLVAAAERAVERLAAAHGVSVATPARVTTAAQRNARDRVVIALAAAAAALAWLGFRLLRRRGAASASSAAR